MKPKLYCKYLFVCFDNDNQKLHFHYVGLLFYNQFKQI